MASNLNSFVTSMRKSVLNQLDNANSIYDLVSDIALEIDKLPDSDATGAVKEKLIADMLKLFTIASSLSDNASRVGDDLSKMVD